MPESDPNPDGERTVPSDDDIYGAVETNGDTVTINERASPPDKPNFHEDIRGAIRENGPAFEDVDQWIVAQEHNGNFQTLYPFGEVDHQVSGTRIAFTNARRSVSIGHTITNIVADEVYIVEDSDVRSAFSNPMAGVIDDDSRHNAVAEHNHLFQIDHEQHVPRRRPDYDLEQDASWLHGSSPENGDNFEIFVPIERATIRESMGRLFQVRWDTEAIFRYYGGSTSLTDQQDGLNCRQLFTVTEDVVPTDAEPTSRDNEVDVLEEGADLISDTSR